MANFFFSRTVFTVSSSDHRTGLRLTMRKRLLSTVSRTHRNNVIVHQIPCLSDNYAYLVELKNGKRVCVDPSESGPVMSAMEKVGWGRKLDFIWNTHHHYDHVGGNKELKDYTGCFVIGPDYGSEIPELDVGVQENDDEKMSFLHDTEKIHVLALPGHTLDHIGFYLPESDLLFSGDTLFAMGCGRLFEGTAEQMFESLNKIANLPDDTIVYAAHEYTQDNAAFALSEEPSNQDIALRRDEVNELRFKGEATVPFDLGRERNTNPFLRAANPKAFAAVRKRKDSF